MDDAAAIMLALSCGAIEIVGITTVFKDTEKRAELVTDLLALYGQECIPVCPGYGGALIERSFSAGDEPVQYGLTAVRERSAGNRAEETRADDFIIRNVKKDSSIKILAMGPMTNLAMAFLREPELMRTVEIISMGGAFMNTRAEWNIACDPEAASIVMEKAGDLIMMGLDVTKLLKIDERRLERWKARGDRRLDYYLEGIRIFREKTGYSVTFHDVLLVAWLIDNQVVSLKEGEFTVELSGKLTRGTMVDLANDSHPGPPSEKMFRFAQSVDLDRFYRIIDEYF